MVPVAVHSKSALHHITVVPACLLGLIWAKGTLKSLIHPKDLLAPTNVRDFSILKPLRIGMDLWNGAVRFAFCSLKLQLFDKAILFSLLYITGYAGAHHE